MRLEAGLSQERLAESARLSPDSIGALERGTRRAPYRETVDMLAAALGATGEQRAELHAAARRPRRLPRPDALEPDASGATPVRVPNNVPHAATSLRGRERELGELEALVAAHKLVTVAGAGGIGKTRLCLAFASNATARTDLDGIWFADLAPLGADDEVAGAVAKAARIPQAGDGSQEESVVLGLGQKRGLLILDNCEHVAAAAARLASAIRTACPGISILATSRQPLRVAGEAVYRLPSLAVPKAGDAPRAEIAREYGAVALFVDRAMAVNPAFVFDDESAPAVVDVCAQLDGIALAIEMAAARLNVLSVTSLAKRLKDRLRLLTGGDAAALPRQRTLSALIDWSYDLLSPAERSVLNRSAAFAGGFRLDAAAAVCADDGQDEFDVLDLISSLVDKSLIIADTDAEVERFRLLESPRAYALQRLDAAGESDLASRRHAEHFARTARLADAAYGSTKTSLWLPPLEEETDNFRRALTWSLRDGHDVVTGATIAGALERFWLNGGFEVDGRNWIKLAIERIDETAQPAIAARLHRARAWLEVGDEKCSAAEAAAALYARLGDTQGMGDAQRLMALGHAQLARYDQALATNRRALELFRASGDERNLANCLDMDAAISTQVEDFAGARRSYEEALPLFRALGSEGGVASVLTGLAQLEFLQGNPARALALAREAHEIRKVSKYATNIAIDNALMALFCLALDDLDEATRYALAAIEAGRQAGSQQATLGAFAARGAVFARRGRLEIAARMLGYIDATALRSTLVPDRIEQRLYDALRAPLEADLDAKLLAALSSEGALWSEERAAAEALA